MAKESISGPMDLATEAAGDTGIRRGTEFTRTQLGINTAENGDGARSGDLEWRVERLWMEESMFMREVL